MGEKMAGGSNDPDDLIIRAFRAYEGEGEEARKINASMFTHALKTWGDKFTQADVDDFVAAKDVIGLFVAGGGEPKEEEKKEEAAPAAEAEAAPEEAPEGGKKKKKKKKAKA